MSPVPQGSLEVEHYTGSCLISTNNQCYRSYHLKINDAIVDNRDRVFSKPNSGNSRYPLLQGPRYFEPQPRSHGGWTGQPLISITTGNPRRGKKIQQHPNNYTCNSSKSMNSQSSYANEENQNLDNSRSPFTRLAIHTQGAPLIQAGRLSNYNRSRNNYSREISKLSKDSSLAHSDNVSVASDESSGNSENSLPRIIKPRKRRKKDRKPPVNQLTSSEESVVSPIVTLQPYMPLCFESYGTRASSESKQQDLIKDDTSVEELINSTDEFMFGSASDEGDVPTTLCQCRYCDPSGVIWDVHQRCYSPCLTLPSPVYYAEHASSPFFQYSFDTKLGSLLSRSWSDTISIKDSVCGKNTVENIPPSSQVLQVSSEIVTSPNGHRDIEIKFYSSSPPDFAVAEE